MREPRIRARQAGRAAGSGPCPSRTLSRCPFSPRLCRSITLSTHSIIGSGVFCGRCFGRCCDGEKGGVCGRVRAAGVRAPDETLSSGDVSGVTSCADLESIDQYCTTYVHACTNDASKCAACMCWRTMSDCGAYQHGAVSALPQYRNSNASFPGICAIFFCFHKIAG